MVRTTIAAVADYELVDGGVVFDCETDRELDPPRSRDRTVPVCLWFLTSSTFRFELHANPEAGRGYADEAGAAPELFEDRIATPVDLTAREVDGRLELVTGELTVIVGLDEWAFRVEDDERVVFQEQRDDVDVRGDDRVEPLGFTEEEINHGPYRVSETGTAFDLHPGESIYGLGENFTEFDKRGQEIESWHVEPLGTETERSYKNVPFHLSTRGYGLLVNTTCRVRYDLGRSSTASATVGVENDAFSFVFFYGPSFKEILRTYTALTGRPKQPPKWSFGVWMSRLGYESREQLETITTRLREESIPADVVHLDPFWMREHKSTDLVWDREQFPDPEGMLEWLHERDFRLSLWEHPHVPIGTEAFETGVEEGYFLEDGTGKPYVMERTCQGEYRGTIVDFTNPDAAEWWAEKHRRLLEMGVDTFKTDYGEYVPEDAVFYDGRTGKAGHNLYPYLYNRTVYRTIAEENGEEEALVWGRAGWTGSQRYPVHWGGDPQTSFAGMAAALRGGLTASLSGIGYWSHDIGGFRGEPTAELYVRWAQFGLLSSHARCHGTTPREPWAFGEEAIDCFRAFARLRYRLLPYIYTQAEVTARTGLPLVRPLVLEYQDDPRTHGVDDQYLLGRDLLVAPVFGPERERTVYLPEGEWIDWWTSERYGGEQTVERMVPLNGIPLFIPAGKIIPQREPTETVQAGPPEVLQLHTTLADGKAEGEYYDEEHDELVSATVQEDGCGLRVDLDPATPLCEFRIDADRAEPETVSVDGVDLERTNADPTSGKWTVDDGQTLIVVDS